MKVLVVGGGGREHAIAWKLAQSPSVHEVICQSGNPGMRQVARCEPEPDGGVLAIADWALGERVDLTIVGPEAYLDLGLVDAFAARGLRAVGPRKNAAAIESSKSFAKELMAKYDIPTAAFAVCDTPAEARKVVRRMGAPIVIKAEGLAAGKGVSVCTSIEEADVAIARIMEDRLFGEAGDRVVVEEFMVGEEASLLAFVDGEYVLPMAPAQDHKAIGEGDTGPNTGGMGAYSPAPVVTPAVARIVQERILDRTVAAMAREGAPYQGVLYAGLMITQDGPKVVEFNCRFGDPEAQAVLPRLKSDLLVPLLATIDGTLRDVTLEWDERACACVVLASGGYPDGYKTGLPITGLENAESEQGVVLFHAGTDVDGEQFVTDGGRVLGVTALGNGLQQALDRAYAAVDKIRFEGCYYRRDIGAKALSRV